MKRVLLLLLLVIMSTGAFAQVELVPVGHRVYDFLRRMDAKGVIDFNGASLPVSRREVALQLSIINYQLAIKSDEVMKSGDGVMKSDEVMKKSDEVMTKVMSKNDRMMLSDFLKEFEFEVGEKDVHELHKLNELEIKRSDEVMRKSDWKNDNKYIVHYNDTNVAVWGHLTGGVYQRNGVGDSVGARKFFAGDLGFEVRGTMFDRVGFAMSWANGRAFVGNGDDKRFAVTNDEFFRTATSLKDDGKFFDHFKGYVRYELPKRWLAVMVGKESVKQGFGFVDNLFFSGLMPYSMIKLDFKYKALGYSFSYGNIKGDSAGIIDQPYKMISTHRLDVKFAKWFRGGFYESVITNDAAFTFVHLNPLSFITSADLNTGGVSSTISNTFMGFDVEVKPVKNVVVQGTFLIDDLNFATLRNTDYTANENKFGYQAGVLWNDAFTLNGLSFVTEYTRLDPFTYSHRDNKQNFTNWGYSMGHQLPPNSDEWAFKFDFNVMARLNVCALVKFQRSGEGFTYDSLGNVDINYGGDINHGERFFATVKNKFLQGDRVNRSFLGLSARWEPVRQWVVEVRYLYKYENLIYAGRKGKDHFFGMNLFLKI